MQQPVSVASRRRSVENPILLLLSVVRQAGGSGDQCGYAATGAEDQWGGTEGPTISGTRDQWGSVGGR